jgi:ATP-dependent Clp protease ATP-binding subunit ClpA
MDLAKLTQMSRSAVTEAQAIARRKSHAEVDSWHLLSALLAQESGIVPGLLEKLSLSAAAAQLAVERELDRLPKVSGAVDASKVYVTQAVNEALTRAPAARPDRRGQARRLPAVPAQLRPRPREGARRAQGDARRAARHDRQS